MLRSWSASFPGAQRIPTRSPSLCISSWAGARSLYHKPLNRNRGVLSPRTAGDSDPTPSCGRMDDDTDEIAGPRSRFSRQAWFPSNARRSIPDIVSVVVLVRIPAVVAFVALSWVCMGAARAPGASRAANQAPEITDAGLIVRELCGKNVALLGESPLHGFAASALSPKLHSQSPTKATSAGERSEERR